MGDRLFPHEVDHAIAQKHSGETVDGGEVEIIAKLSLAGKVVIITVYVP
ncbi:hypothetical protein [Coleofasciculus sp. H7-2]